MKIKITVAKHAGFCSGVKRAIDIAEKTALNGKAYVYGQLVHNERVIEDLKKKGVVFAENIEDIPNNSVTVLRAHGEPETTYKKLRQKGIFGNKLKDATCPLVKLVHNAAIKLKDNGYEVIIFGKKNHPESIGISYYIRGRDTFIIENPEDFKLAIDYIGQNSFGKVAIISQTTMSVNGYNKLIQNVNKNFGNKFEQLSLDLKDLNKNYAYIDTICNPTKQRQADTEEIAKKSDVMIVIGGKNSSNSKELAAKCREFNVETYFIQTAEQLEKKWLIGKETIGVTAGASTPDSTINKVVEKIKEIAI